LGEYICETDFVNLENRIQILLVKRSDGECSKEELEELNRWYDTLEKEPEAMPDGQNASMDAYLEQKYSEFKSLQERRHKTKLRLLPTIAKIAVMFIIFLGIGTAIYYLRHGSLSRVQPLPAGLTYRAPGKTDAQSHYIKLPDSSIVILHAGSALKMVGSKTREVALTGTAYFDIRHMPEKPFVIHVGALKVTVLGTAFNIKQNGDNVAVTVTHGRVKIEDSHKLLAILTTNQQIVYTPKKLDVMLQQVKADDDIEWIKSGLVFNDKSLADIALQLEARYNVQIKFANEEVKKCSVSTNNASSGTESLDDILDFICPAVNASYKNVNGVIVIDGPGCGE
jgi:transmembrane sensor